MAHITGRSLDEWITLQLDKWKELEPKINTNTDSMVNMDSTVIAEVAYWLEQDLITQTNNAFLAYATWDELSNLWIDRGIIRKAADKAIGIAVFSRASLAVSNYTIPAGTLISTVEDSQWSVLTFVTTSEWVLYWQLSVPDWLANTTSSTWTIWDGTYSYTVTAIDGNWRETDASTNLDVVISNWLTNNSILLTWSPVALAISYNIYLGWFLLGSSWTADYTDLVGTTASIIVPPVSNETWALSIELPIESTSAGIIYNLWAGTITKMIEPPVWIEEVTNTSVTYSGSDKETDAIYRARIAEELSNNYWKVTTSWYQRTAEAVDDVASATILHEAWNPVNEISCFITSTWSNPIPSAELISTVELALNNDENRAVCDSIIVYAPTIVTINVTMTITAYDTENYTEPTLTTLIEDSLQSLFLSLGAGSVVKVVDIANTIYSLDAVTDFILTTPVANQTIAVTEIASNWIITINF